jgi:hypothetical protein
MSAQMVQPPLPFERPALPPPGELEAARCVRALALLDQTRSWPGGTLALVGADEATRAALARRWLAQQAAGDKEEEGGTASLPASWIEGPGPDEGALFAALTHAEAGRACLLLTSDIAPRHWTQGLSDLHSRLMAVPVEALPEPDTALLASLLADHAAAAGLTLSPDLAHWTAERLDPAWAAPRALVEELVASSPLPRPVRRAELVAALADNPGA